LEDGNEIRTNENGCLTNIADVFSKIYQKDDCFTIIDYNESFEREQTTEPMTTFFETEQDNSIILSKIANESSKTSSLTSPNYTHPLFEHGYLNFLCNIT
jgi:hypothetical protein